MSAIGPYKTYNFKIGACEPGRDGSLSRPDPTTAESGNASSRALAPAGSGSYHDILARCAEVSEVRLYTSLNSTAARFYIGADRPDFAAACLSNRCSPDQNGLARRGEVL